MLEYYSLIVMCFMISYDFECGTSEQLDSFVFTIGRRILFNYSSGKYEYMIAVPRLVGLSWMPVTNLCLCSRLGHFALSCLNLTLAEHWFHIRVGSYTLQ